jgi:hypothetical protein
VPMQRIPESELMEDDAQARACAVPFSSAMF